jgi:hypothetical protein
MEDMVITSSQATIPATPLNSAVALAYPSATSDATNVALNEAATFQPLLEYMLSTTRSRFYPQTVTKFVEEVTPLVEAWPAAARASPEAALWVPVAIKALRLSIRGDRLMQEICLTLRMPLVPVLCSILNETEGTGLQVR